MTKQEAQKRAEEIREIVLREDDLGFPALMALATRYRIIFTLGNYGVRFSEQHGHWILSVPEESYETGEQVFLLATGIAQVILETPDKELTETFARAILIPGEQLREALTNGVPVDTLSRKYDVPVFVVLQRVNEVRSIHMNIIKSILRG